MGGPGGRTPLFGPPCRVLTLGLKLDSLLDAPFLACRPIVPPPPSKILDPPLSSPEGNFSELEFGRLGLLKEKNTKTKERCLDLYRD